jgi:hypothetical protein
VQLRRRLVAFHPLYFLASNNAIIRDDRNVPCGRIEVTRCPHGLHSGIMVLEKEVEKWKRQNIQDRGKKGYWSSWLSSSG